MSYSAMIHQPRSVYWSVTLSLVFHLPTIAQSHSNQQQTELNVVVKLECDKTNK